MAWLLSPAELPLLAEEVLRAGLWRLKTVALGRWSSSDREWSPTRGKKTFILNPRRLTPIFRRGKRASRVNLEEKSPVGVLTKKVQSCEQARPCNSCDETLLHWAISATWRETERRRSTTCHWVFACVGGDWQRTKPWGTQRGPELAFLYLEKTEVLKCCKEDIMTELHELLFKILPKIGCPPRLISIIT